ncbi:hypothetical protein GCM10009651_28790 [Microbacterium natoriense]|uniref:helix-turn-helix domain-containing protein n=1 Tax=Microbacterium natoriense TaxID=284570 RepID=UPI0031D83B59
MPGTSTSAARSGNTSVRRVHFPIPSIRSLEGCEVTGEYLRRVDTRVIGVDDGAPLRARVARVGDIRFWHVASPEIEMQWPSPAPTTRLLFVMCVSGRMTVEPVFPAGRSSTRVVVIPATTAESRIRFSAPRNEFFAMSVPDPGMLTTAGARPAAPAISLDALRPFIGFIDGVTAVDDAEHLDASPLHAAARSVARSMIELVGGSLTDRRCIVTRATDIMLAESDDPRLTTASLADRLDVSPRTLQAAFAKEELTVRGMLRDIRARSARALRRAQPDARSSTLVRATGFGSESAMFRALRELESRDAAAAVADIA